MRAGVDDSQTLPNPTNPVRGRAVSELKCTCGYPWFGELATRPPARSASSVCARDYRSAHHGGPAAGDHFGALLVRTAREPALSPSPVPLLVVILGPTASGK